MRAYAASSEEALRARDLLKDWAGEGFIAADQYQSLKQDTVCDLRCTNIFLRGVLFFFTLIILGAAMALFFAVFIPHAREQTIGIFLLIFAPISYAAAEVAVSKAKLYRYGIEEALLACSAGFLCAGIMFGRLLGSEHERESMALAAGAIASLWIWYRFALPYALPAAMIFAIWLPGYWTTSSSEQHVIVAAMYAAGLAAVAVLRPRYRLTYLDNVYSIAEACLWLGIYVAINLQLSSLELLSHWWEGPHWIAEFPTAFYWTTFVLIWCLPPIVLMRGVRSKDRFVIWTGGILTILTFVSNKPYLGWPRHTWDPMLLGALLIGVAIFLRRWLTNGPDETRRGFTAKRLSGKDKSWLSAGATTIGIIAPPIVVPPAQPGTPDVHFGGGDSGGGGASSDY